MPALDSCEPAIVRALEKEKWRILDKPYPIRVTEDHKIIFADIRLQHQENQQQIIVVEVKCFPNNRPLLDEFYRAIGQYQVYKNGLELTQNDTPLYMAIPNDIYQSLFQTSLVKSAVRDLKIRLIVVDLDIEEIITWID